MIGTWRWLQSSCIFSHPEMGLYCINRSCSRFQVLCLMNPGRLDSTKRDKVYVSGIVTLGTLPVHNVLMCHFFFSWHKLLNNLKPILKIVWCWWEMVSHDNWSSDIIHNFSSWSKGSCKGDLLLNLCLHMYCLKNIIFYWNGVPIMNDVFWCVTCLRLCCVMTWNLEILNVGVQCFS